MAPGVVIANQQGVDKPTRGKANLFTYALTMTQSGLLTLRYSVNGGVDQTVLSDHPITAKNGPIPPTFRFGFAASTGGGTNVHEITCFKAEPLSQAASSAGLNTQQSSRVQVGTQIYLGFFHPSNSWGELTALRLVEDPLTQNVTIASVPTWNASCGLTGGICASTGGNTTTAPGPANRVIISNASGDGPNGGIPFRWANLTTAQQSALTAGETATAARVQYLRGERTGEIANGGTFRTRTSVLGDIMNSGATWVGPPQLPYKGPWRDALYPARTAVEGSTYAGYASLHADRPNTVYVGANDGMLHGFSAGAYDAAGNFNVAAKNDGSEVLAYVPAAVVKTLHSTTPALDYSSPQYAHNAYVDATPGTGDLYYNGGWHTWVVGGLGGGGNTTGVIGDRTSVGTGAIFALDVTNSKTGFSEANAGNLVVGEWGSNSPVACLNGGDCLKNLGNTYGTPIIRRLHNGNWAVIFGNGLNSSTGTAGVFIMEVDGSRAISFRFLDTNVRGTSPRNGITHVATADLDNDHITDYLYAGDVLGNVWRFDLTSDNAADWKVTPTPVFQTGGLPITTRLTVSSAPGVGGLSRLILGIGTGQILPQTLSSAALPATGTQSLFGVWDSNMLDWSNRSTVRYASSPAVTVTASQLQPQTIATGPALPGFASVRTVTQDPVCWQGTSVCTSGNDKYGWKVALPGSKEQVIHSPVLSDGLFVVNTTIPATSQALSCDESPPSGFTMALAVDSGAAPKTSYLTPPASVGTGLGIGGVGISAVGSTSFVTTKEKKYLVTQTVDGKGKALEVHPPPPGTGKRETWIKLR